MLVNRAEHENDRRNYHSDDPAPARELRYDLDERDKSCRDSAYAVERRLPPPAWLLRRSPVHDHPGLRQRKAHEHSDRIKRNECVRISMKNPDEQPRDQREHDDTIRECEPVATGSELARHVLVVRENAGQTRKVCERCICREYENGERRVLKSVVEWPATEDVMAKNRQD